jgi:hypothetical protein
MLSTRATAVTAVSVSLLAGCHVDFDTSGLSSLFDASPTYLNLPGDRVREGQFSRASIVGTDKEGAFVTAVDRDHASAFGIFPLTGGPGCESAPAQSYNFYPFDPGSPLPTIIDFVEPAAGSSPARLHFVDVACNDKIPPIEGVGSIPPDPTWSLEEYPALLLLARDGRFLYVKPWAGEVDVLATDAQGYGLTPGKIWSVEGDGPQMVLRDQSLHEIGRFGTQVTEFDVTADGAARAAFVDDGTLYLWKSKAKRPTSFAADACNVSFPPGWGGLGVAYYSPCETRRLVLSGSKALSGTEEGTFTLNEGVIGSPTVDFQGDAAVVFFLTSDDPKATVGTLWAARVGSDPEHVADGVPIGSGAPRLVASGGEWRFFADVQNGSGRLLSYKPGAPARELARNVASYNAPLAIVDYDGKVGDLIAVAPNGTTSGVLARGVPKNGVAVDTTGLAVLTGYDGATGRLLLSKPSPASFETVADGVRVGGFRLLQTMPAVGYLRAWDAASGTGILGVRVIETADTFEDGIRASEWREIGWPEPGILYSVPSGSTRGLWYARLK